MGSHPQLRTFPVSEDKGRCRDDGVAEREVPDLRSLAVVRRPSEVVPRRDSTREAADKDVGGYRTTAANQNRGRRFDDFRTTQRRIGDTEPVGLCQSDEIPEAEPDVDIGF